MSGESGPVPAELRFLATEKEGEVSALLLHPRGARSLLVLGHGAGAGMNHPFLEQISQALARVKVATFRYQFPYMEKGRRAVGSRLSLLSTVRSAVAAAGEVSDLPLLAGGKSMGGRMTSLAASEEPLPRVQGLVFLGFPLHPFGKPASERAEHLEKVTVPMLFLQGTRDRLADLELLRPVCRRLKDRAVLHVVEGGDHSFRVPKRSGISEEEIFGEMAGTIQGWTSKSLG